MPVSLTTITGPIYLPNGATPVGGRVSFELSSWDQEEGAGLLVTGPVYSTIDENGQFSVQLYTSTAGINSVHYRMFVIWEDSELSQSYVNDIYVGSPTPHYTKKFIGSFALSGPGPFQVSDLTIISEVNNSSFDAYLEMKVFADRIDLGALDDAVEATAADRVQTGLDATAASVSSAQAQAWAESATEPDGVGTKSAKTWAGEAEAARDVAVAVAASMLSYYDTLTALKADTTNFPNGTLLSVRETGVVYRIDTLPVTGDTSRNDGRVLSVVYAGANVGPDVLGAGETAAKLLASPGLRQFTDGIVRATDIGLKVGSLYASENVTRLNSFMDEVRAGNVNTLEMGYGQYYFADKINMKDASGFTLKGLGRSMTRLTLSADTGSHRGKFCEVGGFSTTYRYSATSEQTVFSGAAIGGAVLTFTANSDILVYVNGEEVGYTRNVGGQSITLDVAAVLADVVSIEVAPATYGRITIDGFTLDCLSGTADQVNQFFNLGAISDFTLSNVQLSSRIGGLIRSGYEGTVARARLERISGNIDPTNGMTVVDVAQCGRFEMIDTVITGARGAGRKTGSMVRLKPISGTVCDTFRMEYCALYCMDGVNRNMEIDMTDGSVTNLWMHANTFDQGVINNIRITDGAAAERRWCRNSMLVANYFRLTRVSPDAAAINVNVDIDGSDTRFDNFTMTGGLVGFGPAAGFKVQRSNAASQVNGCAVKGVNFAHQNANADLTPLSAVIDVGAPNVQVEGCSVSPAFHGSTVRVNRFVRTTTDLVDGLHVTNNNDAAVLIETMSHFNYTTQKPSMKISGNDKDATSFVQGNFNSLSHHVNKVDKYAGRKRFSSTAGVEVYATGPLVGDVWKRVADDTTLYTPV